MVLELDVLQQRPVRPIALPADLYGANVVPFDFIGRPPVSLLLVLVVLSISNWYFHLLEPLGEGILLGVYQLELVRQDVVFSNQSDVVLE